MKAILRSPKTKYILESVMAYGRDSKIYRSRSLETGDLYAIKESFLSCKIVESDDAIIHNNVALVKEQFDVRNLNYTVMVMGNGNLAEYLEYHRLTGDKIPLEHIKSIFLDICCGVRYLHQRGIIHRDIKPHNVILCKASYFLTDFNDAVIYREGAQYPIRGTVGYVAPEVFCENVGFYNDIWALGVCLYKMLTGTLPYNASSIEQYMIKLGTEKIQFPECLSKTDIDFLSSMLDEDYRKRIDIDRLCSHAWFDSTM